LRHEKNASAFFEMSDLHNLPECEERMEKKEPSGGVMQGFNQMRKTRRISRDPPVAPFLI
jgi:hypothetical protein